jgi:hypothetical protein
METLAAEALQELGLDYTLMDCFAPPDGGHEWCLDFADPSAAPGSRVFQVCIRWDMDADYDSVKADLKRRIEEPRPAAWTQKA